MPTDSEIRMHKEWIGSLRPTGVVVAPPALAKAQAYPDLNVIEVQRDFSRWVKTVETDEGRPIEVVTDLIGMLMEICEWPAQEIAGVSEAIPQDLEVPLPEYDDILSPSFALKDLDPAVEGSPWLVLVKVVEDLEDLDQEGLGVRRGWVTSHQKRFERLLREKQIPIGILSNGSDIRIVYAPKGENSGFLTFPVHAMNEVAGRPILAAFRMLLSAERLFALPEPQRLPAILAESRKYQSEVSNALAEQVLASLYELLRGFQAADHLSKGALLRDVLNSDPNSIYNALLTVFMRCVFILFAEDRGLMSADPVYVNHYSIGGLFERLREDAGLHPDTMDQRYGAWAHLCSLFRLVYEGGKHGGVDLPPRHGYLFDPNRYPFLEGRNEDSVTGQRVELPMVADGVVYRVLDNLLMLEGERLSYRNLDVEQIGSVYERMIGFLLDVAEGPSIAMKPAKRHGAPVTVDLEALLEVPNGARAKRFREQTDLKLTDKEAQGVAAAETVEGLIEALNKKIERRATPNIVPRGSMILQPGQERRKSGSYYTPRSLTEPIVRKALEPVLAKLGEDPSPDQILELKICDPAMGSGAFLVEACRQLGDELVKAWLRHDSMPAISPDEDEDLHARRTVAQRCLYGVDRNPMAVDLAKLSLWLATLAKEHAFTFLDHALRHGDSLVGLNRSQIGAFHWMPAPQHDFLASMVDERLKTAARLRHAIWESADDFEQDASRLEEADKALEDIRLIGDLVVCGFFNGASKKEREQLRDEWAEPISNWIEKDVGRSALADEARGIKEKRNLVPFHWELEFPEVYDRENGGFDAIVGNPPFAGKNTLISSNPERYPDWLKEIHGETHGNADLVAHFFRRAFTLLRKGGCFGLLATNTIGQGDTRSTGLRWICTNGGTIYSARKRFKWPGEAAVVVSVLHVSKGSIEGPFYLNGRPVQQITAYLFHQGIHDDPVRLKANESKSFQGSIVLGKGFTFDDTDKTGLASPVSDVKRLIAKDKRNAERIFPYIGGEEVNTSPTHSHHRYVISFGDLSETEAGRWPDLMEIVVRKVKPERQRRKKDGSFVLRKPLPERYWIFAEKRPGLYSTIRNQDRVLVCAQTSKHLAFTFIESKVVFDQKLVVFAFETYGAFSMLQSTIHQSWAYFFGSTMKDDPVYTPTDCFETFPFVEDFDTNPRLQEHGRDYYQHRATIMLSEGQGLTKTYNRFHDPHETSKEIVRLRELHIDLDRAVADLYGWSDLDLRYDFRAIRSEEEDSSESNNVPTRYGWSEETRSEVLARLLALNRQRAEEERLLGEGRTSVNSKRGVRESTASLFDEGSDGRD